MKKTLLFSIFFTMAHFCAAQYGYIKTSDDYYRQGEAHRHDGYYDLAIKDFSKAIELDSVNKDAWLERALAKGNLQDYAGEIADCEKLLMLDSSGRSRWFVFETLLDARAILADYNGGIADCNRMLVMVPRAQFPVSRRGEFYLQLKDFKSAINDFNFVLANDTTVCSNYFFRASARYALGDYTGAAGDSIKGNICARKDSIDKVSRRLAEYGGELLFDSKYAGAIEKFNKALELNPRNADAYYYRARTEDKTGNYKAAVADYNRFLGLATYYLDSARAYGQRASVKLHQQDFKGALADCELAIKLRPGYDDARGFRGDARLGLKNYKGAIADFDSVLKKDPYYYHQYFYHRAAAKYALHDTTGARKDSVYGAEYEPKVEKYQEPPMEIEEMPKKETKKTAPKPLITLKDTLEWARWQYDTASSLATLKFVLSRYGDNGEVYYYRAGIEFRFNQPKEGCADLRKAKALGYKVTAAEIKNYCK